VSWLFVALLAAGVIVLIAAEWPRVGSRLGVETWRRRAKERRKPKLHVIRSDTEEFAASVQRDLERLPTIEERDPKR